MDTNEKDAEYWFNEGEELKDGGKYDEAIGCYDKAIELNSENLKAVYGKGHALLMIDKHDEAIECYDKIIEMKPDNPLGWYGKGYVLKLQEKYENALEYFDKVLELNPEDELMIKELIKDKSKTFYHMGVNSWTDDFEKCVFCLENALQLGLSDISDELSAHAILGNIYHQKLDRHSDAIKEYEKALEIDEQSFEGKFLSSINMGESSKNDWKNFEDMAIGELADCYGVEAHALLTEHNEVDKAIEFCKKGLSIDNTSQTCKILLGECYWSKERWIDEIEAYSNVDIESLEPSLALTVVGQLIDAYRKTNDPNSTSKYCEMALETDNQSENMLISESHRENLIELLVDSDYNIALELFKSENYDLAIRIIDKLLEYNPKYLDGLCLKGECLLILHNIDGAFECFNEALRIDSDCVDALVGVGNSFYFCDELEKSVEYYDKALEIEPSYEKAAQSIFLVIE